MSRPFRRRNALAIHDLHYGPNMTPMVDVVMVILVFFMASAVVLGPEWFLKASLPTPGRAAASDEPPITLRIALAPQGAATVARVDGGEPMSLSALRDTILEATNRGREVRREVVVVVDPRADVAYEDVVRVHELASELGIARIGLAPAPGAPRPAPAPDAPPDSPPPANTGSRERPIRTPLEP